MTTRSPEGSSAACARSVYPVNPTAADLAEIEAGRVHPTVETLWKLAEALEIPLSGLFRLAEQEHRKETPYK